ncbi:VWA domain-containing protein [bacterium]|nr:VWA domain-containing protein [bacterium]
MIFYRFSDPWILLLLAIVPLLAWWRLYGSSTRGASMRFSNLGVIKNIRKKGPARARIILLALRLLAVAMMIVALARPQSGMKGEEVLTEGVDIILTMDISSSMLAEDIKPNRVEAAKEIAAEFIKGRKNDRIGMVVFASQGFTQCPLTLDYGILLTFLKEVKVGLIEDGTAFGMGMVTAINRLRTSEAKSKVIIALTDGRNNRGEIDPVTAAQAAQALGIKVYTIGAGTRGTAMYPVEDPFFGKRYVPMQVDIDDATLGQIARMTGGRYFRATDRTELVGVFKEIDELEKTEIKVQEYTRYSEQFYYFAGLALLFLLIEVILMHTRFRKIP